MRFSKISLAALLLATTATPAFAQDEESSDGITVSGSATVVTDYRFRGFTQTGEEATVQGGITVSHDSGVYAGAWGSGINFANGTEIDLFAGYSHDFGGVTADVGATFYLYPGTSGATIVEPYLKLSGDLGPVSVTSGIFWAPSGQTSLGGASSIYLSTDVGFDIPNTGVSLSGHIGYADSNSFLGGYDDGKVFDYSIGLSTSWKALTFGVSYINTDTTKAFGIKEAVGADGAVVASIGASF